MKRLLKIPPIVFIISISFVLFSVLLHSLWDMNWWPTDEKYYYYEGAKLVPSLQYLSQLNEIFDREHLKWTHGKEVFVFCISVVQSLTHDLSTIRPIIIVCIVSFGLSCVLVFLCSRFWWGSGAGFLAYFLFLTSFWPHLYILFTKHQLLGLCFFFCSVFLIVQFRFFMVSGCFMAASLSSSTVSPLYLPYLLGVFVWLKFNERKSAAVFFRDMLLFFVGFALIFGWVNYPNYLNNIQGYLSYVDISSEHNHFYYNQPVLQQWIPGHDLEDTRAGWLWVIRYFFLMMPVIFPLYIVCVTYLIKEALCRKVDRKFLWTTVGMILLSFSSPILVEIKGVAQYGANYFTSFVGIIMLICFAFHIFLKSVWSKATGGPKKLVLTIALLVIGIVHLAVNSHIFVSDLYPCRMATTRIARTIKEMGISRLHTYAQHPLRNHVVGQINPDVLRKIKVVNIQNLEEVEDGFLLIPPVTLDTLYLAAVSNYNDFDEDLALNAIFRDGKLSDYAAASFKTVGSSPYWAQEEEILSFRYLMLNQFPKNMDKTKAWLLDVRKLKERGMLVNPSDVYLKKNAIKNIGTISGVNIFHGRRLDVLQPVKAKAITARVYKVGNPEDGLYASFYTIGETWPLLAWVPVDKDFMSHKVDGKILSHTQEPGLVFFQFPKSFLLNPGSYYVVIYRTGAYSDHDFYRIYSESLDLVQY